MIELSILLAFTAATALAYYDKIGDFINIDRRKTLGDWITYGGIAIMYTSTLLVYN